MTNDQRLAWLDALETPVWVLRNDVEAVEMVSSPVEAEECTEAEPVVAPTAPNENIQTLHLGPGQGSCLFVCDRSEQSATPLAGDLSRLLSEPAVWAWPDEQGVGLADAVEERLLTHVVVFGPALGQQLAGTDLPAKIGSARTLVVPTLAELIRSPQARRQCWKQMVASGVVGPR